MEGNLFEAGEWMLEGFAEMGNRLVVLLGGPVLIYVLVCPFLAAYLWIKPIGF